MSSKQNLYNKFRVTDQEYKKLDAKFGRLAFDAAWKLIRGNYKNNCLVETELEDVVSELKFTLYLSGSYYKRQTFIENCFVVAKLYCKDKFIIHLVEELESLWLGRRSHGANRQKFGDFHEEALETIVKKHVPLELIPDASAPLVDDEKFINYCKSILWNRQKALGKKISRERTIRVGMVSLSDNKFII